MSTFVGQVEKSIVIVLSLVIRIYRILSSFWGPHCRFVPSCSQYMLESLQTHRLVSGLVKGIARLLRCHPWNAGGVDPVSRSSLAPLAYNDLHSNS